MSERPFTFHKTPVPGIGDFNLPLTRNDLLLILVAFNEVAIGVETYLAHSISGGIKPGESIPMFFGPIAGLLFLLALYLRVWRKAITLSTLLIIGIASASVVVGILGTAFHWDQALAPAGDRLRWNWIIYAPPVLGPLAFAGVGLMGIIAALEDTKPESGKLSLPGVFTFYTPLKQTQQLLWLVALGLLAATVSSFLDHGRTDFENVFVWIPAVSGLFATVVTLLLALYPERTAADYFTFFWAMMLMVVVGVLGVGLHFNADLPEGLNAGISAERLIRGAPVMAPMLFANMGLLGIITIVGAEAVEKRDTGI